MNRRKIRKKIVLSFLMAVLVNVCQAQEPVLNTGQDRDEGISYQSNGYYTSNQLQDESDSVLVIKDNTKDYLALLQSAIVPGAGQISKKYYTEGLVTMGCEIVAVTTGIVLHSKSQDKLDIMRRADVSYKDFNDAKSSYNSIRTGSRVVWTVAGLIYVFNLYRAYFLPEQEQKNLTWSPVVIPTEKNYCMGIGLSFKF